MRRLLEAIEGIHEGDRGAIAIHPLKPKDASEVSRGGDLYAIMPRRCRDLAKVAADQLAVVAKQCELMGSAVKQFDREDQEDSSAVWGKRENALVDLHNEAWKIFEKVTQMVPQKSKGGIR